jgi:hypothetical protein
MWPARTRNREISRQHSVQARIAPAGPTGARESALEQEAMKKTVLTFLAIVACWLSIQDPGFADPASPFKDLPGRWVGDGRLGFKEGKFEAVKCRATYFLSDDGVELTQNIRCASASGNVEVKSAIKHNGDALSGTWNELIYNLGGDLSGQVTPNGFRISVRGEGLTANMEVIVREGKQIIEIQFFSNTLVGLTLVLSKG